MTHSAEYEQSSLSPAARVEAAYEAVLAIDETGSLGEELTAPVRTLTPDDEVPMLVLRPSIGELGYRALAIITLAEGVARVGHPELANDGWRARRQLAGLVRRISGYEYPRGDELRPVVTVVEPLVRTTRYRIMTIRGNAYPRTYHLKHQSYAGEVMVGNDCITFQPDQSVLSIKTVDHLGAYQESPLHERTRVVVGVPHIGKMYDGRSGLGFHRLPLADDAEVEAMTSAVQALSEIAESITQADTY